MNNLSRKKCSKCKGKGWIKGNKADRYYSCNECNGFGELERDGSVIVELEEFEVRCNNCDGWGWWADERGQYVMCSQCNGKGKIDWINVIKNKYSCIKKNRSHNLES